METIGVLLQIFNVNRTAEGPSKRVTVDLSGEWSDGINYPSDGLSLDDKSQFRHYMVYFSSYEVLQTYSCTLIRELFRKKNYLLQVLFQ